MPYAMPCHDILSFNDPKKIEKSIEEKKRSGNTAK
jgi:hypothetical protein